MVVALSIGLLQSLGVSLNRLFVPSQVLSVFAEMMQQDPSLFTQAARLYEISVELREEVTHVTATAWHKNVPTVQNRIDRIQNELSKSLQRPVIIAARIVSLDISNYHSGPKPADVDD